MGEASATAGAPPTVSLYAIAGVHPKNAMLLPVTVRGHHLVALLDSGSTTNFINADLFSRLQLPFVPHPTLRVLVANGDRVPCHGVARDVALTIGAEEFSITCFGISLGEFDLILGFDFLRSLGPVLWDCESLSMSFMRARRCVQWTGLGSPYDDTTRQQAIRAVSDASGPTLLDRLLLQFGPVFDEPCGLPPVRPYDHRIHLLPGTAPIAVRPYCYPQLQKDELERQCAAMLEQGIIRPSTSPFSAPVLLVCKANNSWRFCIDYRALNAQTSKDRFPIPVGWTSSSTSSTAPASSRSWTFVRAITRCGCIRTTSARRRFGHTRGTTSSW
ncbi:uncharacterized protein [Miscanthus floridulus]|uniref:uncharacterized protein n=1 Tax=Miscanthus floridulus TaxID=154761 RepID=UPI0034581BD2